jgi:magnesium transporter
MSDPEKLSAQKDELVVRLAGPLDLLQEFLTDVHPADLAEWMQDLSERQAWHVFDSLSVEDRAEVLEHAEDNLREQLLEYLTPRQLGQVVKELPADEVVDILGLTDADVAQQVLRSVNLERAEDLRRLAAYAPDSAGGLMTSEFVVVPVGTRIGDAIKLRRRHRARRPCWYR